ncbi:MAG: adenylyl-sulfate kinase, partial [Lentisphaerae bacterium]|nr:adenylyl-sulfate kinase [Lentisphaerota bacterium]
MKTVTQGRLFLLTGLSGSGKSTLGHLLVNHLNQYGVRNAYLLDGDAARAFFDGDSAFDAEARDAMTRRMAFAALTMTQNNVDVVMANIAGLRATRRFLRRKFADFIEIFLDVDLDTLIRNDVKGLYKTRLAAERPMLVGVDIPYERPESPELAVFPHRETPEDSLKRILEFLAHRGPIMGTKADTLASLTAYVKRSRILPQVVLTWDHLTRDPVGQLHRVRGALGAGPYILRSSCRAEDARSKSNAGAFKSVPDVPDEGAAFQTAARRVRDSYAEKGVEKPDAEQILVQPMLARVRMAGVVCTRYKAADSPYYVVNYDDRTGRTETVTSGCGGDMIFISRFLRHEELGAWQALIDAVRELEELYPKFPVEVEFAVLEAGEVVVLQCRALHVHSPSVSLEQSAGELIQELKLRLDRYRLPQPHLPGADTILSDMADWNPSEMIGDRPSTLAYSIYRELVTDRTWHEARASQGYFDVLHANLMLSMARKPYMDTRMSFASLTPAALRPATRERLVTLYLDALRRQPQLHDKVEFDLLYTCFDLGVERRIRARNGLAETEIAELLASLRELTNTLVAHAERD